MPVHIERRNGKHCVIEPDGTVVDSGCYDDEKEALARMRAINANVEKAKTKVQGGVERTASEYLCVPDPDKPSTWKLPKTDKNHKVTTAKLGQIAAALGKGFRGQPVNLPSACPKSKMVAALKREYKKLGKEPPDTLKGNDLFSFMVRKDDSGVWNWLGIVSNNWIDSHLEIITSKAHKRFVELVDSGEYGQMILQSDFAELPLFKEIGERGTPDLWYWHLPVPIGYADTIAYAEPTTKNGSGFLIAMGRQKEGELYDLIFEKLSEAEPGENGMSHGMPNDFLIRNDKVPRYIDGYISTEFTVLPSDEAANFGTGFGVTKEGIMNIPEHKLAIMRRKFGDEAVERFGALLDELEFFATDSDIPRKENNMSEDTVDAQVEEEVLETEEAEVEETETEEVEETETETESEPAVAESSDETGSEEEEQAETGMALDPAGFQVPTDPHDFAAQIASAMKEVFVDFQEKQNTRLDAIQTQLDEQRAEIATLKQRNDKLLKSKATDTPPASLAEWLAADIGSVIGKEETRIHGNKDREFYNLTKQDEVQPEVPGVPKTIANMITRQRGNARQYATSGLLKEGQ